MFGPPGHLYVYFTYGMHWCANVTCGDGLAVLLRALAPVGGLEAMRAVRPAARRDRDLCSGPGKLTQALGITGTLDGVDLVGATDGVTLSDDGTPPPEEPVRTPRVGITVAMDHEWRYYVPGDPNVSRPLVPRMRR
jgi:DNA-3-methyladenine glycosylase